MVGVIFTAREVEVEVGELERAVGVNGRNGRGGTSLKKSRERKAMIEKVVDDEFQFND